MFKVPLLPKVSINIERWRWNDEFNIYVSSKGRFKDNLGRDIKIKINSGGYAAVKTACGLKLAHRVVLLTFRPRSNAMQLTVDHLNHNKRDNSLKNLEWCTEEENQARAFADQIPEPKVEAPQPAPTAITNGKQVFPTIDNAAMWVLSYSGNTATGKLENIKKRINSSIRNNTTYCGFNWKEN